MGKAYLILGQVGDQAALLSLTDLRGLDLLGLVWQGHGLKLDPVEGILAVKLGPLPLLLELGLELGNLFDVILGSCLSLSLLRLRFRWLLLPLLLPSL